MIVFDMTTGSVIEPPHQEQEQTQMMRYETHLTTELQLQEIHTDSHEVRWTPPALVDINAILNEQS